MANLTITVDEEVLRRARARALEQGTSVNAILAEHLARFARIQDAQTQAVEGLLALVAKNRRTGACTSSMTVSVRAAAAGRCETLLTEDLSHGQELHGVRVENPFVTHARTSPRHAGR